MLAVFPLADFDSPQKAARAASTAAREAVEDLDALNRAMAQTAEEIYAAAGLPFMHSVIADRDDVEAAHILPPPYVVKPFNEGSSVGVYIVGESANGPPRLAQEMPPQVITAPSST